MAGKKITVEFLGDSKDLEKTLDSVDGKSSKLSGVFGKVGKAAAAGFAIGGAAAVVGGKHFFDLAASVEQMGQKAETVFGSQLGKVDKWAAENAHAMGLTRTEATGLAADFGDLLIPMGFSRKEAAKMSTDVVGLSGALSQWSGGTKSAADVTEILNSAMLGETDGLKALGISISAADVEAELLRKGQDKLTGAAKQQAEAQAIQKLIMEKSTDAQKAFAEGGSPLLSAQAELKAKFGELQEMIAVKLIPVFTEMADWFLNKGLPAIQEFGGWLGDHLPPVFEKIQEVVKKVMDAMNGDVGGGLAGVKGIFEDAVSIIRSLWDAFGSTIVDFIRKAFDSIKQIVGGAFDIIQGIFKTFSSLLKGDWQGVWDGIKQILSGAWEVIKGLVKTALNVLGTVFELGWTALKKIVDVAWDGIKALIVLGITKWVELLQAIPGKFTNALSSLAGTVGGLFRDAMDAGRDKVVGIGATIVDWISGIPGRLLNQLGAFTGAGRQLLQGFVDGMKNAAGVIEGIASNVWNMVRGLLNGAIDKINAALEFTVSLPLGKSIGINPTDIPHLAKGGMVTRPTLALIGEDGPEAVVPLSRKHNPGGNMPGMGGGNVYITVNGALDPLSAAREVEKILLKLQRATGRPLAFTTS